MLTVDEVAMVLRVHPRSIQHWAREGRVPSVRVGRSYRIARADVVRWMLDASSASDTAIAPPRIAWMCSTAGWSAAAPRSSRNATA